MNRLYTQYCLVQCHATSYFQIIINVNKANTPYIDLYHIYLYTQDALRVCCAHSTSKYRVYCVNNEYEFIEAGVHRLISCVFVLRCVTAPPHATLHLHYSNQ